jgi:single-strand DNA-binding protein
MAAGINAVAIVGNLTRDPELRSTGGGTSVANLGVAVNERIKKGDNWEDYANYFDVTVWGRQAEACAEHLIKGSPVAISGHLRQERWSKEGNNRSKVVIVARDVQFLPSSKGKSASGSQGKSYKEEEPDFVPSEDSSQDIPF